MPLDQVVEAKIPQRGVTFEAEDARLDARWVAFSLRFPDEGF